MIEPEPIGQQAYESMRITPTVSEARVLISRSTDASAIGTTRETLYNDIIETGTLGQDGDAIHFRYNGLFDIFVAGDRYVYLKAFGVDIAASGAQIGAFDNWTVTGWIIRVSNSVLRCEGTFTMTGIDPVVTYSEIPGLDLANNFYDFDLDATSGGSPGQVSTYMATAWFVPAAAQPEFDYLLGSGDHLLGDGALLYT